MASARDDHQPYEGGGAGGKFRKRPLRKSLHATPYDRRPPPVPTPEFRNPNGGRRAWLSKLVDPAQRLIASGANRFFASVFRKRLPPPSPPSPPPQAPYPPPDLEARSKQQEVVSTDSRGAQKEVLNPNGGPSNASGDLNELEHILLDKKFTRFEIDRLTAMLHSRTVDLETEEQRKIPEATPLRLTASIEGNRKESEVLSLTLAPGSNRGKNQLVSTPLVNSTVLEGDAASPTELVELAKSYMHKRPISPSRMGFRSQSTVENSSAIFSRNLNSPSRLPFTPLAPKKNPGSVDVRENGFITPRSRGRTAIYNMARTPYSRVHPTTASKVVETALDVYGGNSSHNTPEGGIKRRSSVLDNDIGSYGAIRRTRQKSNLSYRGLGSAAFGNNLSSASKSKPQSFVNAKSSAENGDNVFRTTVPSKSTEMASKILQQLDTIVSPKDKSSESKTLALMDKPSPSKLTPSMLRGQALKSLDHVDSSKFVGRNEVVTGSPSKEIANFEASTSGEQPGEQHKLKKNGSADYRFTSKVNGVAFPRMNGGISSVSEKDASEKSVFGASNSVAYPLQKKRAFQMSAFEDFVDLDEDILPNGNAFDSVSEEKGKANFSLPESKSTRKSEYGFQVRSSAPALTEVNPVTTEVNRKAETENSSVAVAAEKSSNVVFPTTSFPSVVNTDSSLSFDKGTAVKDSNASPVSNFAVKVASAKDTSVASPISNFSSQSNVKGLQSDQSGVASDPKPEISSSLSTPAVSFPKFSEPNKADNKSTATFGVPCTTPEPKQADNKSNASFGVSFMTPELAPTSRATIFSVSTSPMNVSPNNGSSSPSMASTNLTPQNPATPSPTPVLSSTPSVPAASLFKFGPSVPSESAPPALSFASSAPVPLPETSPAPVFKFGEPSAPASGTLPAASAPVFQFAPSMPLTTIAPAPEKSNTESEPVKFKQETSFGNLIMPPATAATSASPLFGFTTNPASTSANQSQNIPVQFSSSASSPTFGINGSSASLPTFGINGSTNSPFSSSHDPKLPGFGSSSSEGNMVSSSSANSSSSVFNSSWQPPKSPVFNANSSPSTGFSFGATIAPSSSSSAFSFGAPSATSSSSAGFSFGTTSSTSSPSTGFAFSTSTNTSPTPGFAFGASSASPFVSTNGAASSSSLFKFNSPSPATAPTQPVFGNPNPNPGFGFGNPNPSEQMSMEDSMAEDTIQVAAPTNPVFGQPPVAQSPPGFAFGGQPSAAIVNPFQLGSQPNAANPASPSPFQASGSFGSNFSMGSGGSGVDKSNRKFVKVKHKQRKK